MSINKRYFYLLVLPLLLVIFTFYFHQISSANTDGSNVVISQIQVGGAGSGNANQEFVELYNPTNVAIDMSGWRLTSKTSTGSESNRVANISGTIAAHGYFLIAHPTYINPSVTHDLLYSASSSGIANNGTVILYSAADSEGVRTVVDKVGFGTVSVADFEGVQFGENPVTGGALLRKASSGSTAESITEGGAEATSGNGYDTDNNAGDFVLVNPSFPRNIQSPTVGPLPTASIVPSVTLTPTVGLTLTPTPTLVEPSLTPILTNIPTSTPVPTSTPTPTITATPTQQPTSTPTPTVTLIPTLTPTPTLTSTPIPTGSPVPTITSVPTVMPELSPTVILSPTVTPTPTLTHGGHHYHHNFNKPHFYYKIHHKKVSFFGRHISVPFIHCYFR